MANVFLLSGKPVIFANCSFLTLSVATAAAAQHAKALVFIPVDKGVVCLSN